MMSVHWLAWLACPHVQSSYGLRGVAVPLQEGKAAATGPAPSWQLAHLAPLSGSDYAGLPTPRRQSQRWGALCRVSLYSYYIPIPIFKIIFYEHMYSSQKKLLHVVFTLTRKRNVPHGTLKPVSLLFRRFYLTASFLSLQVGKKKKKTLQWKKAWNTFLEFPASRMLNRLMMTISTIRRNTTQN